MVDSDPQPHVGTSPCEGQPSSFMRVLHDQGCDDTCTKPHLSQISGFLSLGSLGATDFRNVDFSGLGLFGKPHSSLQGTMLSVGQQFVPSL